MGKSHKFFLLSPMNYVLMCAVLFSWALEARPCGVRLKQALVVTRDSTVAKHTSTIDQKELLDEARDARAEAKDEGTLKVTKGSKIRSPDQVEAWLMHISNQLKKAKSDPDHKMSIEEFFGMIEGGFGREGARFEQIFKEFGINHVRLVGKKGFASKIVKDGEGAAAKDAIYIEVPDFPVDQPEKAAFWIKDLYLTLHDASTNMVAHKVNNSVKVAQATESSWIAKKAAGIHESITSQKARAIWVSEYKKQVRNLDRGVRNVLLELDAYLKSKNPAKNNPLELSAESLPSALRHHGLSLFKATDSVIGGELASKLGTAAGQGVDAISGSTGGEGWGSFGGGFAGLAFGLYTKVKFPLESWKPSEKWLLSKEAFELERERLESRLETYRYYRGAGSLADLYAKGSFLFGALSMGYFYAQNQSMTGGTEEGLHEEKEVASKELDVLTQEQLSTLNVDELHATYKKLLVEESDLRKQLAEAIRSKNDVKADTLNTKLIKKAEYMKRVLAQIEAMNPDGLEYER